MNWTSTAITVNVVSDAGSAVAIPSPLSGGSSTSPASITLTATATAISGQTITGVQFYQGSTAVGPLLTTAPYA